MLPPPQRDLVMVLAVRDRRRDHQERYLAQREAHPFRCARVFDPREMIREAAQPRLPECVIDVAGHGNPDQNTRATHESSPVPLDHPKLTAR